MMRQIYNEPPDVAAALICEFHTQLNREREQTLAARSALQSISAETMTDDAPTDADAMTITEMSRAIGVKASTLRFWESAGLVTPERISTRSGTAYPTSRRPSPQSVNSPMSRAHWPRSTPGSKRSPNAPSPCSAPRRCWPTSSMGSQSTASVRSGEKRVNTRVGLATVVNPRSPNRAEVNGVASR